MKVIHHNTHDKYWMKDCWSGGEDIDFDSCFIICGATYYNNFVLTTEA